MLSSNHFLTLSWMNCIAPKINEIIKISLETQVRSGDLSHCIQPWTPLSLENNSHQTLLFILALCCIWFIPLCLSCSIFWCLPQDWLLQMVYLY